MRSNKPTKKSIVLLILAFGVSISWFAFSPKSVDESSAQVVDAEDRQKLEWDRSISNEKLGRLRRENEDLQKTIKDVVAKTFPKLKVKSEYSGDPDNGGTGRKGESNFSLEWGNKTSHYSVNVTVVFSPEEAKEFHADGVRGVSLPEFYPAPTFLGSPSVVSKSVEYNKSMTDVRIFFVKGRLVISAGLRNHKRTAGENEKALVEFLRIIYPVINAKLTIQEV